MIESAEFTITLNSTGVKTGLAEGPESGLASLPVAAPPEFGGPPNTWSPEHLFVASIASCFMTTFMAIAELSRMEVRSLRVPSVGTIERGEDRRYRFTRVELNPEIKLSPEANTDRVLRLVEKAENACLISRSLNTVVTVVPALEIESE